MDITQNSAAFLITACQLAGNEGEGFFSTIAVRDSIGISETEENYICDLLSQWGPPLIQESSHPQARLTPHGRQAVRLWEQNPHLSKQQVSFIITAYELAPRLGQQIDCAKVYGEMYKKRGHVYAQPGGNIPFAMISVLCKEPYLYFEPADDRRHHLFTEKGRAKARALREEARAAMDRERNGLLGTTAALTMGLLNPREPEYPDPIDAPPIVPEQEKPSTASISASIGASFTSMSQEQREQNRLAKTKEIGRSTKKSGLLGKIFGEESVEREWTTESDEKQAVQSKRSRKIDIVVIVTVAIVLGAVFVTWFLNRGSINRVPPSGDRFLTDSQRAAIKAVCSKHPGQRFLIQSAINTPEARKFGSKIYEVLHDECGWAGESQVLMSMNLGPGIDIASGSEDVKASVAKQPSTLPLASALYHAMEDSGVVMMEGGTLDAKSIPKGVIVIAIGPKPY